MRIANRLLGWHNAILTRNAASSDRGVSSVLGEALMIAIAVVLVGVVGFLVFNLNVTEPERPMATLEYTQHPTNQNEYNITVTHISGDDLPAATITVNIEDTTGDGDENGSFTRPMTAGETQRIATNVEADDIVRLIWHDPDSDVTQLIGEYTVE